MKCATPTLVRLALTAAETGHLVLATLHPIGRASARPVINLPAARTRHGAPVLADCLRAVVAQTLIKTADGAGRVAAFEAVVNPAVRHHLREGDAVQLYSAMQTGWAQACKRWITLLALCGQGVIDAGGGPIRPGA